MLIGCRFLRHPEALLLAAAAARPRPALRVRDQHGDFSARSGALPPGGGERALSGWGRRAVTPEAAAAAKKKKEEEAAARAAQAQLQKAEGDKLLLEAREKLSAGDVDGARFLKNRAAQEYRYGNIDCTAEISAFDADVQQAETTSSQKDAADPLDRGQTTAAAADRREAETRRGEPAGKRQAPLHGEQSAAVTAAAATAEARQEAVSHSDAAAALDIGQPAARADVQTVVQEQSGQSVQDGVAAVHERVAVTEPGMDRHEAANSAEESGSKRRETEEERARRERKQAAVDAAAAFHGPAAAASVAQLLRVKEQAERERVEAATKLAQKRKKKADAAAAEAMAAARARREQPVDMAAAEQQASSLAAVAAARMAKDRAMAAAALRRQEDAAAAAALSEKSKRAHEEAVRKQQEKDRLAAAAAERAVRLARDVVIQVSEEQEERLRAAAARDAAAARRAEQAAQATHEEETEQAVRSDLVDRARVLMAQGRLQEASQSLAQLRPSPPPSSSPPSLPPSSSPPELSGMRVKELITKTLRLRLQDAASLARLIGPQGSRVRRMQAATSTRIAFNTGTPSSAAGVVPERLSRANDPAIAHFSAGVVADRSVAGGEGAGTAGASLVEEVAGAGGVSGHVCEVVIYGSSVEGLEDALALVLKEVEIERMRARLYDMMGASDLTGRRRQKLAPHQRKRPIFEIGRYASDSKIGGEAAFVVEGGLGGAEKDTAEQVYALVKEMCAKCEEIGSPVLYKDYDSSLTLASQHGHVLLATFVLDRMIEDEHMTLQPRHWHKLVRACLIGSDFRPIMLRLRSLAALLQQTEEETLAQVEQHVVAAAQRRPVAAVHALHLFETRGIAISERLSRSFRLFHFVASPVEHALEDLSAAGHHIGTHTLLIVLTAALENKTRRLPFDVCKRLLRLIRVAAAATSQTDTTATRSLMPASVLDIDSALARTLEYALGARPLGRRVSHGNVMSVSKDWHRLVASLVLYMCMCVCVRARARACVYVYKRTYTSLWILQVAETRQAAAAAGIVRMCTATGRETHTDPMSVAEVDGPSAAAVNGEPAETGTCRDEDGGSSAGAAGPAHPFMAAWDDVDGTGGGARWGWSWAVMSRVLVFEARDRRLGFSQLLRLVERHATGYVYACTDHAVASC